MATFFCGAQCSWLWLMSIMSVDEWWIIVQYEMHSSVKAETQWHKPTLTANIDGRLLMAVSVGSYGLSLWQQISERPNFLQGTVATFWNIAAVVKGVHVLYWHMLQVIFTTNHLHYPSLSAAIQPTMSLLQSLHRRWIAHKLHFLVATAAYPGQFNEFIGEP